MAHTDPGTRSPGKLVLNYSYSDITHKAGVRFIVGVDLEDITAVRADATAFANVFKAVLPPTCLIGGWEIHDPAGSILYAEPFGTAIAGTAANDSAHSYASATQTLSGNGVPTTVTGSRGRTRLVVFGRGASVMLPGARQTSVSGAGAGWPALAAWLHSNLRCFADFYGQHAEPKTYVTLQFNARAQRHYGN